MLCKYFFYFYFCDLVTQFGESISEVSDRYMAVSVNIEPREHCSDLLFGEILFEREGRLDELVVVDHTIIVVVQLLDDSFYLLFADLLVVHLIASQRLLQFLDLNGA